MTRILKLKTSLLALIFSILMETLFFVTFKLFGTVTEFGRNTNIWS